MPLSMEVGVGAGDVVLDGVSGTAPSPQLSIVAKLLDG